jgi:Transglutaminase-like superfamily
MLRMSLVVLLGFGLFLVACGDGSPEVDEPDTGPVTPETPKAIPEPVAPGGEESVAPATDPEEATRPARSTLDAAIRSIEKTPEAALALIRENVSWRPYRGVIRGPAGTWAGGVGNAVDVADLLANVLKRVGIKSRIAFGRLDDDQTTARLAAVFAAREVPESVLKALPETPAADPLADQALRALAREHAWVQVQKDGAWVDLDPTLESDTPVRVVRTRPEIKKNERRKLRVEVLVKRAGQPKGRRVLHIEQPVADLVRQRVVFVSPGIDREKKNRRLPAEKLWPMLVMGDRTVSTRTSYGGAPIEDASNPAGRLGGVFGRPRPQKVIPKESRVEEIVLAFSLTGGGIPARTGRRYIYVAGEGGLDRLGDLAVYAVGFGAPIGLSTEKLAKDGESDLEALLESGIAASEAAAKVLIGSSHRLLTDLDRGYGVVSVYPDARVAGIAVSDDGRAFSTDLVFDSVTTRARVGTPSSAVHAHAAVRGRLEGDVEGAVLAAIAPGGKSVTVRDVFTAADAKEIPFIALSREKSDALDAVDHPALAERIMGERLAAGHVVITTKTPVACADGNVHSAWYEIDRKTFEWRAVLGDGRHSAYTEERKVKAMVKVATAYVGAFKAGYETAMFNYAGKVLELTTSEIGQDWSAIRKAAIAKAGESDLIAGLIAKYHASLDTLISDTPEVYLEVREATKQGGTHGQHAGVLLLMLLTSK